MMNPRLQEYINSRMDQPTVILPCRILILNHKRNGINAKMTPANMHTKQINKNHFKKGRMELVDLKY